MRVHITVPSPIGPLTVEPAAWDQLARIPTARPAADPAVLSGAINDG